MIDNKDEAMIARFFEQASQKEIEDNGFSRRVMRRINPRPNWAYRLWTAACLVGIVAYALAMRLPQLLAVYLEVAIRTTLVSPERLLILLPIVAIALTTATTMGIYKVLKQDVI